MDYLQHSTSGALFRSFWMGGFESAGHINRAGQRIDMIAATQHDVQADADYRRLQRVGIRTARDAARWQLIDRGGRYDFAALDPLLQAARRHGVQVIWTLCHYGWPDDLDLFSAAWVDRFVRYVRATAEYIAEQSDEPPIYTPINEISFFAWAAGDVAYIYPLRRGCGTEIKRQLVRATIAACDAIWEVDPRARIAHVDPLIHVVTPRARPELAAATARQRAGQFESWDMLCGLQHADLGGHPRYLDVMGLNYYHANQWEHPGDGPEDRIRWEDHPRDERWVPLHRLLAEVFARYRRPLFLSETSHFGVGRGPWIAEIADELAAAHAAGVPVEGACIYPIIDRPDWDDGDHWHNSGLWDIQREPDGTLRRVLNRPYYAALRPAIARFSSDRQAA